MNRNKSITLTELLIAISLLGLLVIGLSSIDTFSRFHLMTSDRRAKLQHDAAFVLGHMSKEIARAIGNEKIDGAESVVEIESNPTNVLVKAYIDASGNGKRDTPIECPPGPCPGAGNDHWIAYRYDSTGSFTNRVRYCGLCRREECNFNTDCLTPIETLSSKITDFVAAVERNPLDNTLQNNYVSVQLTTICWDPSNTNTCGNIDNPRVQMRNTISMPAVSTN